METKRSSLIYDTPVTKTENREVYFIIHPDDNDNTYVYAYLGKGTLLDELERGTMFTPEGALDSFPIHPNTQAWGGKYMIIKGTLVSPRPVSIIESWDIK